MSPKRSKQTNRAATLADVGLEAGVSAMAASAVLNGARTSTRISPETRARIVEAAGRLNYRPNAAARALARRRMNTIGVAAFINDGGELDHYFLELFNGIITEAAARNQTTTVIVLHNWQEDAQRIPLFCDGRVDGIILIAPMIEGDATPYLPRHTPFVALHSNKPLPGVINIEPEEEPGARAAVEALIAAGHRRILHLSGTRALLGSERRISGYKAALAAHQIPFDPTLLVEGRYSMLAGREVLAAWLTRHRGQPLPDAIFAASDAIALGCIEVLAQYGFSVPDDISVVGFDDTLAARITVPQLTTVRQPLRVMGARAVDVLLERIQQHQRGEPAPEATSVVIPVELVSRNSIQPPRRPRPIIGTAR